MSTGAPRPNQKPQVRFGLRSNRCRRRCRCSAVYRKTARGVTTTLGRGGSDYSAAIVGAALNAREIQIWTDVSGVLTSDPRVVPNAQTIPILSYQEAAELAYFGAKVLHPKTIQPAIDKSIPVRVCNSRAPKEGGTLIVAESEAAPQTVKAIAHKNGITTVQVTSARMLGAYGFLRALFEVFDDHRVAVDVVTTSEVSVSLSIDDASGLAQLIPDLEKLGTVQIEENRTIFQLWVKDATPPGSPLECSRSSMTLTSR